MNVILAHPLTEPGGLGLPPVFLAGVVVTVSLVAAARAPLSPRRGTQLRPSGTPAGRRSGLAVAGRVFALGVLVLVVVAGRLGRDSQIDNIAPSLAIGVAWPVLLGLALLAPNVWPRISPFATLAGLLSRVSGEHRVAPPTDSPPDNPRHEAVSVPGGRWWAVAVAMGWVFYLGIAPDALEPRVVGAVVGGYTIAMLAGCQIFGATAWLHNAELITVLLDTTDRARRAEVPFPPATGAVVAALAGGLAFSTLRLSTLWIRQMADLGINPLGEAATVPGMGVAVALTVWAVRAGERWSVRAGAPPGTVVAGVALVTTGIGLAQAMLRERALKAAVLVLARASNPLGGDADVFGTAGLLPANSLIGENARVAVQMILLAVATFVGARATRRIAGKDAARPAWVVLGTLSAIGVLAVTAI